MSVPGSYIIHESKTDETHWVHMISKKVAVAGSLYTLMQNSFIKNKMCPFVLMSEYYWLGWEKKYCTSSYGINNIQ